MIQMWDICTLFRTECNNSRFKLSLSLQNKKLIMKPYEENIRLKQI